MTHWNSWRLRLLSSLGLAFVAAGCSAAQAADKAEIEAALAAAHAKYAGLQEGKNADYIPALAKVDPDLFGIALVTVDGKVYTQGDVSSEVSIQSISKVFTMAKVFEESGPEAIRDNQGVDATGQVFNSIAFAGRKLAVLKDVYDSEAATNQRNQAIAQLMFAYGRIKENPAQATDIYTKQCAVGVNAKDLATMAATLANGGKNPVSGKQLLNGEYVPEVLAVMATAGLYDDSGKWLFTTGLPAKSGVGGGILAVSPGKFGIAVISPPLDAAGNSVRAQKAIADISNALGGNPYAVEPK